MENPFVAKWSAQGHMLCLGHWTVTYLGKEIVLPEPQVNSCMNTRGNFSWMFPDDDEFIEGQALEEWVEQNVGWIYEVFEQHKIPIEPETIELFYLAINQQDWTCSSCGGCI